MCCITHVLNLNPFLHPHSFTHSYTTCTHARTPDARQMKHRSCSASMYDSASIADKRAHEAFILLRLMKFVVSAVSQLPSNEVYLITRVKSLVFRCVQLAASVETSINYLYMLRALFNVITSNKLDATYAELQPILPVVWKGLIALMRRTSSPSIIAILLELTMLLPSRQLPPFDQLPVLLVAINNALSSTSQCASELPQLALRTLEFWIENINPAYFVNTLQGMSLSFMCLVDKMTRILLFAV